MGFPLGLWVPFTTQNGYPQNSKSTPSFPWQSWLRVPATPQGRAAFLDSRDLGLGHTDRGSVPLNRASLLAARSFQPKENKATQDSDLPPIRHPPVQELRAEEALHLLELGAESHGRTGVHTGCLLLEVRTPMWIGVPLKQTHP